MADSAPPPPAHGLARIEVVLFVFGVLAFAFLMLAFGGELVGGLYLPIIVVAWIVGGLAFIWWFDRHLAVATGGPLEQQRGRRKHQRREHQ